MNNFFATNTFTWLLNTLFSIIILFSFYRAAVALKSGTRQNYVEYAPSLMTSLGLFGTFFGIFIGLLHFDSNHIDSSIQQLLNGLQTAFVTSIVGMAFAILFKVKQTSYMDIQKQLNSSIQSHEVEPKDIYELLSRQYDELVVIANGIGGNDERSMVGQLQMLRTDVIDLRTGLNKRHESFEDKLWRQLSEFSEMMSKSATQQVIEALKQVIVDFNEKLTDQFGDNFKRLDESVKKLVDWQTNYMEQLDEMTHLYSLGVESIGSTKVAVESIRTETARIPADMKLLSEVINVNQHQISELARHLEAFVLMRDQAVIAVPNIQQKLEEIGRQLHSGAEQVNMVLIQGSQQFEDSVKHTNASLINSANVISNQSEKISEDMKNALELLELNTERIRSGVTTAISEAMSSVTEESKAIVSKGSKAANDMLASFQQSVHASIEGSNKTRTEMEKAMSSVNTAMLQHSDRSLVAVEKQVQEAVNRTNDAVNSQLKQLDEALSRQLNAALEELGTSLATIARHLVDTYQRKNERSRVDA